MFWSREDGKSVEMRNMHEWDGGRCQGWCVTEVAVRALWCMQAVALPQRQDLELEVEELKMLSFSLRVTKSDRIRNECMWGTAQVMWLRLQSAGCPAAACSVLTSCSVCVCVCVAVACSPVSCEIASFVTNYSIDPRVLDAHTHTSASQ